MNVKKKSELCKESRNVRLQICPYGEPLLYFAINYHM